MTGRAIPSGVQRAKMIWKLMWEKEEGIHTAYHMAIAENVQERILQRSYFATVRPAHNGEGLLDSAHGFVVTRKEFDDLREFATIDEAKLYVESIYELERKN